MTKFSATLPKGEANGLTSLHHQLLANPKGTHLIVGVIDVKTITTDVDTGDQVATVRFRRVEPIAAQDADEAVRLMQRGTERRTGATMLPIEIEDELRELMANLDFSTGELTDEEIQDLRGGLADEVSDGIAEPAEGPGDDEPGQAPPAEPPAEEPADRPGRAEPAEGPADDQPPTLDDDPEPTQPQEPVEDPAPAPAEAPKKRGRGRPRKVKEEPPAPAAPEDLAAATVPAAPWDDFEASEPETKED